MAACLSDFRTARNLLEYSNELCCSKKALTVKNLIRLEKKKGLCVIQMKNVNYPMTVFMMFAMITTS